MTADSLAPIAVSVSVPWSPEAAFQKFVHDFGSWWPTATHSIGGPRVRSLTFEPRVGGCIYEEHVDGRRFQWGQVLAWEPPHLVRFTFHPSRDPATAQDVDLRFDPEGQGTRLTLTAAGWEKWGRGARRARRGYTLGWGYLLNRWAGRRTGRMRVVDAVGKVALLFELVRYGGRRGLIDAASGEIARA